MLLPTIVASEPSYPARQRGVAKRGAKEDNGPHKSDDRLRNGSRGTRLEEGERHRRSTGPQCPHPRHRRHSRSVEDIVDRGNRYLFVEAQVTASFERLFDLGQRPRRPAWQF
jgi:hypothetical protein